METTAKLTLEAPLLPHEIDWITELADRLPEDVDLTFEESKILARLSIREWPDELLLKVKDVIDAEDFLVDDPDD